MAANFNFILSEKIKTVTINVGGRKPDLGRTTPFKRRAELGSTLLDFLKTCGFSGRSDDYHVVLNSHKPANAPFPLSVTVREFIQSGYKKSMPNSQYSLLLRRKRPPTSTTRRRVGPALTRLAPPVTVNLDDEVEEETPGSGSAPGNASVTLGAITDDALLDDILGDPLVADPPTGSAAATGTDQPSSSSSSAVPPSNTPEEEPRPSTSTGGPTTSTSSEKKKKKSVGSSGVPRVKREDPFPYLETASTIADLQEEGIAVEDIRREVKKNVDGISNAMLLRGRKEAAALKEKRNWRGEDKWDKIIQQAPFCAHIIAKMFKL